MFDEIYSVWAKTTGAEDKYWMPTEYCDSTHRFKVYAVNNEGVQKLIASELKDEDAEFIAGIHGLLPDLIRRLGDALDEADRADSDKDARECRIAELELEVQDLSETLMHKETVIGLREMECQDYRQIIQNLSQAKDAPWHQRTG